MAATVQIFDTQTTDGDSDTIAVNAKRVQCRVWGNFDGASVEFKVLDSKRNDYVSLDSTNAVLSAEGSVNLEVPDPSTIRATLSGAGGSTSLNATVTPIE